MKEQHITYPAVNDRKRNIHMTEWIPEEENPKRVIIIAHGITEHMGRYRSFAKAMTDKGIAVAGIDLRGHGKSVLPDYDIASNLAYPGYTDVWKDMVRDIRECKKKIAEQFPAVPITMMGFSLGSFLMRAYLSMYQGDAEIDSYLFMGTGRAPASVLRVMRGIVKLEAKRVGEDKASALVRKLCFGSYNSRIKEAKTAYDWLCSYEPELKKYMEDGLCHKEPTPALFREMLSCMIFTGSKNILRHSMSKDMPILFLSGKQDPVGDNMKGILSLAKAFRANGFQRVSETFVPGRHDILHECPKTQNRTIRKIQKWMESL